MESNPILLSELSLDSDIPLYSQIVNIVKRNLSAGTLVAGEGVTTEYLKHKNLIIFDNYSSF